MKHSFCMSCCAAAALAIGFISAIAVAQDDPFGGVGDAELEPIATVDPAPADENTSPEKSAPAGAVPQNLCRCVGGDTLAPSVAHIRQVLRTPLKDAGFDFNDQPLEELAQLLQEEYGIPIKIDVPALDELGVSADTPINARLHGISLRAALRLMLEQHGLTYVIKDEVLLITTPDQAAQHLEICVYDVRDLIDASKPAEIDSLVDTIASCIATESWATNGGGEAEIRTLKPGLLIISQVQPVHDEVRELLDTIRLMHTQPAAKTASVPPTGMPGGVKADDLKVVTRSYYLQINQPAGGTSFIRQVRELITDSLPDEQWVGRLDNGEPVVLTVLPDRIVLRHLESVHGKVESLLKESSIAYPPSAVASGGGGGGGFFNPRSSDND